MKFPIWAIFCSLKVRSSERYTRVSLEIPCRDPKRAKILKRLLGAGRIVLGKLIIEGPELADALRLLSAPEGVVAAVESIDTLRNTRGVRLSHEAILEKRARINCLREAVTTALNNLAPPRR